MTESLREQFFASAPRYEHLGGLGRGGMGVVFKANDRELGETIAIKVLAPVDQADAPELLQRFKNEIGFNRRIKHPNIARLYDYGIAGRYPFLSMEFVPGRDLGTLVETGSPLSPFRVAAILRQVALGTAAAHEAGIIHRDLKPQNIMLDDLGHVSVLDFGIALSGRTRGLTMMGTTVGTPQYMAPEQSRGAPVDGRSDLYSLGVIAFEMLTGKLPFTSDDSIALALQHNYDPVPAHLLGDAGVPPEMTALVLRCLAKKPASRFQSATELANQLTLLEQIMKEAPPARRVSKSPGAEAPTPPDLECDVPEVVQWPSEQPTQPRIPTPGSVGRPRPVVLVVDDEPQIRNLASIHLMKSGCETLHAASGEEALQLLTTHHADVVLLDVTMPVIDGFDLARILRSMREHTSLPLVFMSSFVDRNRMAFANQSGAVEFLSKPLDFRALVKVVWKILEPLGFTRPPAVERQ